MCKYPPDTIVATKPKPIALLHLEKGTNIMESSRLLSSTTTSSSTSTTSPPCNVIYVKEKTFLCRWGKEDERFCRVQCQPPHQQQRKLKRQTPTTTTTTTTAQDDESDNNNKESASEAPRPPHEKYKEASEKSGIQLGSVSLVPLLVLRHPTTTKEDEETTNKTVQEENSCLSFATILSQLGGGQEEKNKTSNSNNNDATTHTVTAAAAAGPPAPVPPPTTTTPTPVVKVVYCVRREGCGACRMHGQSITQLTTTLTNVQVMGIIKEPKTPEQATNKTAQLALADFQQHYFPFPLYRDTKWDVFKFLGDRKLSNATLVAKAPKLVRLYAQKKIENVIFDGGRDVYTQGGILVFDAQSQLRYIYYDRYGDELDIDALRLAIQDCQRSAIAGKNKLGVASRLPTRRRT